MKTNQTKFWWWKYDRIVHVQREASASISSTSSKDWTGLPSMHSFFLKKIRNFFCLLNKKVGWNFASLNEVMTNAAQSSHQPHLGEVSWRDQNRRPRCLHLWPAQTTNVYNPSSHAYRSDASDRLCRSRHSSKCPWSMFPCLTGWAKPVAPLLTVGCPWRRCRTSPLRKTSHGLCPYSRYKSTSGRRASRRAAVNRDRAALLPPSLLVDRKKIPCSQLPTCHQLQNGIN